MVQTGDPTGTGKGGQSIWGQPFPDEVRSTLKVGAQLATFVAELTSVQRAGNSCHGERRSGYEQVTGGLSPFLAG